MCNEDIIISGICDVTKVNLASAQNLWTEIAIPESLTIPREKPDIEQLEAVNVSVNIIRKKIITTPTSTPSENNEGKILTGKKLIIEGELVQTVSYTADIASQPVHSAQFNVPFSAYIVLPDNADDTDVYEVFACVEDVYITNFCARQIFKNVTLLLHAVKVDRTECEDDFETDEKSCSCNESHKCCGRESECEEEQVQIVGVCSKEILSTITTGSTWTQIFIPEILWIPKQKPDVESLVSLNSKVVIISQKVIKTPSASNNTAATNEEDTKLTGRKLIIEGILRQRVMYVAENLEQSVHSAHFDIPFSTFIVLPTGTDFSSKYKIEPYIEDIFICKRNKRQLFKNTTLFIKATKL